MRAVMISIHPKWCELIANGKKTVEVRKTRPKLETPFKVYIYCTKPSKKYQTICGCMVLNTDELYRLPNGKIKHDWSGELMCYHGEYSEDNFLNGKVIGEFVCDAIEPITEHELLYGMDELSDSQIAELSCVESEQLLRYKGENDFLYAWHISDLVIYNKPKELSEFIKPSKIGCCNEGKCRGCKYLDRGNGYNIEDDCTAKFSTDEFKPLRRPPQSWCYVEGNND